MFGAVIFEWTLTVANCWIHLISVTVAKRWTAIFTFVFPGQYAHRRLYEFGVFEIVASLFPVLNIADDAFPSQYRKALRKIGLRDTQNLAYVTDTSLTR